MVWQKGQSGNPSGRKRAQWRKLFDAAIAVDTKKHKQSIFEHAIAEARKDNTLLASILRKCLPDLKAVDTKIEEQVPFRFIVVPPGVSVEEADELAEDEPDDANEDDG